MEKTSELRPMRQQNQDLTEGDFKKLVIESKKAFLVQIQADWSGECFIMTSILNQLAREFSDDITFGYVNVETNEELTKHYGVTELPFLLFFNHGELLDFLIGLQSKKTLRFYIKKTITHQHV
jgi:thioredoxin 1